MKKSYEVSMKDMKENADSPMRKLDPVMKKGRAKKGSKAYAKKMSEMC